MNKLHEDNRRKWNVTSKSYQEGIDREGIWDRLPKEPGLFFCEDELKALADVKGKKACVLGSGDNHAVLALAGMGARVTSVDISENQLEGARRRARKLGLDVAFVRSDVCDLAMLESGSYDVIYTGGHIAVWVSDLKRYYREAVRILKTGGLFIANEYHPFRRLWKEDPDSLKLEFRYFDRGPHSYDDSRDFPGEVEGSLPSHEFHWTIEDYVSAMTEPGCRLLLLKEYGDGRQQFEVGDLRGLPLNLLLVARKEV